MSNSTFTTALNRLFTIGRVTKDPAVAIFAVRYAEKRGWDQAEFARQLYGDSQEARQRVNNWLRRGLPAKEIPHVAQILGLTVEQLLKAGKEAPPEPALAPAALEMAREWSLLRGSVQAQIQALVRAFLEQEQKARAEGSKSEVGRRASLQGRRGHTA